MLRTLMHAKLHGARVTDCNLAYQGSITIDRELMQLLKRRMHRVEEVAKVKIKAYGMDTDDGILRERVAVQITYTHRKVY